MYYSSDVTRLLYQASIVSQACRTCGGQGVHHMTQTVKIAKDFFLHSYYSLGCVKVSDKATMYEREGATARYGAIIFTPIRYLIEF